MREQRWSLVTNANLTWNVAVEKEDGGGREEELGVAGAAGEGGAEEGGVEGVVVQCRW